MTLTTTIIDTAQALRLYRSLVLIREFETALDQLFTSGVMRGTAHFCVGQEATAVGVSAALEREDFVISYHRGHGHFLAQGGDPRRIMAELFGKAAGYSGGRGGSQHMSSFEHGFLGSNGITGGGIPVGTGAALALKLQGRKGVVVVFFGDGAANQGAFHESLNLGSLWKLPVVYVCENNLYSMFTHLKESTSVTDIADRASGYGMPGKIVDGNDVLEVMAATRLAVARARSGQGPTLLECKTYRFLGHSKSDKRAYRTREEEAAWQTHDPLVLFRKRMLEEGALTREQMEQIEADVDHEIEASIQFAKESPYPGIDGLEESVYA